MAVVLTNTLSGKKEPLVPREPGHVRLYWCGVTVYAPSHVGHARALIAADVLFRWLRARGLRVTFVRNFTDVDDKIIRRAHEQKISPQAIGNLARINLVVLLFGRGDGSQHQRMRHLQFGRMRL